MYDLILDAASGNILEMQDYTRGSAAIGKNASGEFKVGIVVDGSYPKFEANYHKTLSHLMGKLESGGEKTVLIPVTQPLKSYENAKILQKAINRIVLDPMKRKGDLGWDGMNHKYLRDLRDAMTESGLRFSRLGLNNEDHIKNIKIPTIELSDRDLIIIENLSERFSNLISKKDKKRSASDIKNESTGCEDNKAYYKEDLPQLYVNLVLVGIRDKKIRLHGKMVDLPSAINYTNKSLNEMNKEGYHYCHLDKKFPLSNVNLTSIKSALDQSENFEYQRSMREDIYRYKGFYSDKEIEDDFLYNYMYPKFKDNVKQYRHAEFRDNDLFKKDYDEVVYDFVFKIKDADEAERISEHLIDHSKYYDLVHAMYRRFRDSNED